MEQKSFERLIDVLSKWPKTIVRTIPGVMYQVLCGMDDIDHDIEYRFHWFLDCTETYVHNHRYAFHTYCLEGEYIERLWEIINDDDDATTFQFSRAAGKNIDSVTSVPGTLCPVGFRHHFPGNILFVDTNEFHSISPVTGSDNHVVTFVARKQCSSAAKNTHILSSSNVIEEHADEARPATPKERRAMHKKLQQILQRILLNSKLGLH